MGGINQGAQMGQQFAPMFSGGIFGTPAANAKTAAPASPGLVALLI